MALDRVSVDFHVDVYRFDDDLDPWDRDNWRPLTGDLCSDVVGRAKLLSPSSFLLDIETDCPNQQRVDKYGWHEGELRVLGGIATGELGGTIKDEHVVGLLMTEHAFTPLGFRFFDREENLLQLIDRFSAAVATADEQSVTLRGEVTSASETFVVEMSLAPHQGYLMTRARYAAFFKDGSEYKPAFEFVYRLFDTTEFPSAQGIISIIRMSYPSIHFVNGCSIQ